MSVLRTPVTSADHIQGPMDAPVTLVEYGDYECGYCGLAFPNIKGAQKHFAKKLRFVFRHFPLTEAHPFAEAAAEAAEYAGTHDLFWEMHDGLYTNQDELGLALSQKGVKAEADGEYRKAAELDPHLTRPVSSAP